MLFRVYFVFDRSVRKGNIPVDIAFIEYGFEPYPEDYWYRIMTNLCKANIVGPNFSQEL